MVKVSIKAEELISWLGRIITTVERNVSFANGQSSRKIATSIRENMLRGLGADGQAMASVTENTMNTPIRVTSDKRIRSTVNPSVNGMVATGDTARSIKERRVDRNEYIIESTSERGNAILVSNAYPSLANKGVIKGPRAKRDPMQVTERHMDIVENEILSYLDKAFS